MSLNENDIVFRWVDNSEITKCKVGNCTLDLDFTISRQELIRMGLSIDGDLTIRCRFTKALYNLESSKKKNISIAKYLSVSKGLGGQYSGWLEYRSTASKNRLLNCTIDHKIHLDKIEHLYTFLWIVKLKSSERKKKKNYKNYVLTHLI